MDQNSERRIERTLWYQEDLDDPDRPANRDDLAVDYGAYLSECVLVDNEQQANLISSLTRTGKHAPVIDLDVPARLVQSKTPGHSHLFIDHKLDWKADTDLLSALAEQEIVDGRYTYATQTRGMSFVRLRPELRPPRQR